MSSFAELEINLDRRDATSYAVDVRFNQPRSDADIRMPRSGPGLVRFDLARLRELHLDIDAYGAALSEMLFADQALRTAYGQARASAATAEISFRLRLGISASAPELHELRWETMRDPLDGVPLVNNVLFSRYLSSTDWRPVRTRPRGSLRALVVIAAPADVERFKPYGRKLHTVDRTFEQRRALRGLANIPCTVLSGPGLASLERIIAQLNEGYDIFYLVAHGALINGRSRLWLEDEQGRAAVVAGDDLADRIATLEQSPRLAVLVSCQSADGDTDERSNDDGALAALGPRLAQASVPAVLAMQGNISQQTAERFIQAFFTQLDRDGQIDRAVTVARAQVSTRDDAWMPVLFTRLKSGRLWYTPGFTDDQGGFVKWPTLVDSIVKGRCTPILGSGLLDPLVGSTREIARRWADMYAFPMAPHERDDLPQVAQFLAVNQDHAFLRSNLAQYLRQAIDEHLGAELPADATAVSLAERVQQAGELLRRQPHDPFRVLARLPFPVYITTNPDSLLEEALTSAGRLPDIALCPWNEEIERSNAGYEGIPSAARPLVYHLFGSLQQPESLVITEDDHFDYLIGVTRNNDLIPDSVRVMISDAALLFLGFQLDDWNFRIIFRSLMSRQNNALRRKYTHVAVQIDPEEGRIADPILARRYLESYFGDAKISIFWGSVEDFIRELERRFEGRR